MSGRKRETTKSPSRRELLGTVGVAGAVAVSGCGVLGGDEEEEQEAESVTIGISIPQEGRYANEGAELEDGYRLAAKHLNDGSGAFTEGPWAADIGAGILGDEVELDVQDTDSSEEGARESAQTLINEGADVITGGATAMEGHSHQEIAGQEGVLYLGAFTPDDNLAGLNCSRYAFNEMYNQTMAAQALASVVPDEMGPDEDITFAQLFPDTDVGARTSLAFRSRFEALGWSHNRRDRTRVGTRDFSDPAASVVGSGADMYILNYTGLAAANAIRDVVDIADDDVYVVVPFMNRRTVANAGSALEGVFGTLPWQSTFDDSFSQAFLDSWDEVETETEVPSELSYLAYVQLCQYAAAAERAGTLDADGIIAELEGYEYDLGLGTQELRACDHQAMRGVPVVRGLPSAAQEPGAYTERLAVVDDVAYSCEEPPASNCNL